MNKNISAGCVGAIVVGIAVAVLGFIPYSILTLFEDVFTLTFFEWTIILEFIGFGILIAYGLSNKNNPDDNAEGEKTLPNLDSKNSKQHGPNRI